MADDDIRAAAGLNTPSDIRPDDDPLLAELADALWRIAGNYAREGSGPGSRFEGERLEVAQARFLIRRVREDAKSADGSMLAALRATRFRTERDRLAEDRQTLLDYCNEADEAYRAGAPREGKPLLNAPLTTATVRRLLRAGEGGDAG